MDSPGSATRRCSRQTCTRDAVMTLTYVYSDSTAVVGPLAGHAEPHAYDLCGVHADRLTVPRGWRVVRLELPETRARREDIGAPAEAVRKPEPSAPVRERPRSVLRDVSLPRESSPRTRRSENHRATAPEAVREAGPESAGASQPLRTARSESSPTDVPASRRRPGREPGPEVAWRDVPVPVALQRPHLRRPAARGGAVLPGN